MMAADGGADEGRSHGRGRADDSMVPTDGGGASGGGARGGDGEPMSQDDWKDLYFTKLITKCGVTSRR